VKKTSRHRSRPQGAPHSPVPVSIDGKKKQSETYKIIGILTKIAAPDK